MPNMAPCSIGAEIFFIASCRHVLEMSAACQKTKRGANNSAPRRWNKLLLFYQSLVQARSGRLTNRQLVFDNSRCDENKKLGFIVLPVGRLEKMANQRNVT